MYLAGCLPYQKNGAIVRQVVGYDRLEGEHAYRQLTELYRALRLYVNCFQPSMKLLAKERDGKKIRCVYDPAKTPLHRLLLSGILPAEKQQELTEVAEAIDPIGLLNQLQAVAAGHLPLCCGLLALSLVSHFCPHPRLFHRTLFGGKTSRRGECPHSDDRARDLVPRAGTEKACAGLAAHPQGPL
jgi:hypothetical protein